VVSEDWSAAGGVALHLNFIFIAAVFQAVQALINNRQGAKQVKIALHCLGLPPQRRRDKELPVQVLSGHEGPVAGLAFSPTSSLLASASWDHTLCTWDVFAGKGQESCDPWPWLAY
jgi:WD40 repeat protein